MHNESTELLRKEFANLSVRKSILLNKLKTINAELEHLENIIKEENGKDKDI